jgi:CheY-like chemotaxis protein
VIVGKRPAWVEKEKFDGIFLDLEMPNLNGFDLARPHPHVILE